MTWTVVIAAASMLLAAGLVLLRRRGPGQVAVPDSPTADAGDRHDQRSDATLVREGRLVSLRRHSPANRAAFQAWYADAEIASLLRHDLETLSERESRIYFDTIILPLSQQGVCFAIHDRVSGQLIGTTALTETDDGDPSTRMLRIVIGEKSYWDRGYGTEATALVLAEGFERLGLERVELEVFSHNPRAIRVYERVGFVRTGEHTEWLGPRRPRLQVIEMRIDRTTFLARQLVTSDDVRPPEKPGNGSTPSRAEVGSLIDDLHERSI